jgi:ABC-type nitrate/sulfonate/bicarbonate transport system substrate-binding protein
MRKWMTASGLACALVALLAGGARAEPVKIRLAWVTPVATWGSLLLEKKDLAKHLGQSYVLEPVRFQGTPLMITAMANNELEIGNLAYSTFALAVQNAKMDDLRIIADEFQDGVEGYYSNEFLVLKDSPIEKVADLKGKVLATNAAGSAIDIAMRAMLRRHGLEDKRDYSVTETQFPLMRAMLDEKKVAMIQGTLPFSLDPELRKIARTLFTSKDAIGRSQFVFWTARKAFLDKNRAAMMDFMEDALRIERWFFDPANHAEVMQIAARITKQPPERFSWAFTKSDFYRDPNMLPDLAALQSNVNTTRELGFVKIDIDVPKFADLSFAQEAAKRLK